ncbi:metallophosphoesterase [bacterium]|nr:metallophosphoesterase [bacterium]
MKTGCTSAAGLVGCTLIHKDTMKSAQKKDSLVFGVITDLHYADKDMNINRYYRESDTKLRAFIETCNSLGPAFVIELGDIIDKADRETETGYLETIDGIFSSFAGKRYYVLGNHDVATFSKEEFIRYTGMTGNYYSFDEGTLHFIVLDANYNGDGSDYNAGNFDWTQTYIHPPQQEWLKADLAKSLSKTTIVFVHQNLHDEDNPHGVKNAPEIRSILEHAGNVRLVFQGHDHKGASATINGIPYISLRAAVEGSTLENNAYAIVHIRRAGGLSIEGYGKQASCEV